MSEKYLELGTIIENIDQYNEDFVVFIKLNQNIDEKTPVIINDLNHEP